MAGSETAAIASVLLEEMRRLEKMLAQYRLEDTLEQEYRKFMANDRAELIRREREILVRNSALDVRRPIQECLPIREQLASIDRTPSQRAQLASRQPLEWPKWNPKQDSFPYYINKLIFKYNTDEPLGLNGDKYAAWYNILHTLPDNSMKQIFTFWQLGGDDGTRSAKDLIEYICASFGRYLTRYARGLKSTNIERDASFRGNDEEEKYEYM
ncbi:hypothetical protein CDD80_5087 [Ophiocordyceps camponoti-rufipedis]|uniref:Uncharacterized protein n=1 Tax=Ophiocordyceps camponoti-rufipedis TaxID=2004952 RepID=A0A2C5ZIS5_9HYPO|nr:hypothetical protein CDD80_5087 [Ophiocordyceps camponoti-rufipedis]